MEMEINGSFKEQNANPIDLLLLINKYVQVELIKNTSISGFMQSIDPIDHSLIILIPKEDKYHTTLIPGNAISCVSVKEPEENLIIPVKEVLKLSPEFIAERKQKVAFWFKKNLIPITVEDDNIIIGNVTILPPYTITDICTNNLIVAMHITDLLDQMPKN